MRKLNTTGSYYHNDGKYWSYDTKLTDSYNGYRIFNNTFYSMTTRKHQSDCKYNFSYDIELTQCGYGDWDCAGAIQNEIEHMEAELKTLEPKRNTQKKLETIESLKNQIDFLKEVLGTSEAEETEEKTDWFEEFQTCWNELSEANKEHVRKGLGDNLIQSEEQAKTVTAVIKSMLLMQKAALL